MGKVVRRYSTLTVLEAAKKRVRNIFDNGHPVYLSFSGGKDSICIADVVYSEIMAGNINAKQLTVIFIDEEAIFPDVEKIVIEWKNKFLMAGAKFWWFCIECLHFNCFNNLTNDETFICWDRYKQDSWVRQPPKGAIMWHPLMRPREETYQSFLARLTQDGIGIVGVRVAESVQRLIYISKGRGENSKNNNLFPIFDWSDNDVWLYIRNQHLNFPIEYLYMWQIGTARSRLRISQFFSIDTAKVLVQMDEYYPDLMQRVCKREPNAYLATLYWDSEMFRSAKRSAQSEEEQARDYKALVIDLLSNIDANFETKQSRKVAKQYSKYIVNTGMVIKKMMYWKKIYQALKAGDPKGRVLRSLQSDFKKLGE